MTTYTYGSRLEPHAAQVIDRLKTVDFEFDGKPARANEGDTVASALYASGVTTFSRSFKYHRPRGLLCVAGRCPNCLVNVDGVPNVRACTEPVREGMKVRHQNAWPSLERDMLSFLDRLDRLTPVGFYYKTFYRPALLWRLAQPIIRQVGGLGEIDVDAEPKISPRPRHGHADVAIVGGGPAGLAAALSAAGRGARVTLIDDQPSLGGRLRFDVRGHNGVPGMGEAKGFEIAARLAEAARSSGRVHILSNATAFGLYEDNLLGVLHEGRLVKLRARRVVLATGSFEVPIVFEGNDLPGVMLSTGAQRLVHLYGVRPGRTAVVATSSDRGYYAALDLLDSGTRIAAVVDTAPSFRHDLDAANALKSRGVMILPSHAIARAHGPRKVTNVVVARLHNGAFTEEERGFDCDMVCMSGRFQPASSLLYQAGFRLGQEETLGKTVPRDLPPNVFVAGEVTGIHDLRVSLLEGKLAGVEAAQSLNPGTQGGKDVVDKLRRELVRAEGRYRGGIAVAVDAPVSGQGRKRFVCFCEDVTAGDVVDAIDEGFDDVQSLKRYSTVSMGPCQGKMCLAAFVEICARHTGRSVDEIGVTTARPPVQPVPLGALSGPSHLPVKRTAIDWKHRQQGASMVDLGPWQRAYSYGSPREEYTAVRERVGIIDVGTLGKLDVRGREAPALLDKLYTHLFSGLRVGRIRYGVLCADNGAILDDGTVTRLAEDHYFVTTTTGNVDLIEEWFKWWMAGTEMCAHVTNVTSAFSAINVAGPKARDTLAKLTDVDLSPQAFRYMRSARGSVADVSAILLRIGFVGETGWEIHFPAEYGEYLWDALLDAGEEFGIAPFGLEAQRILRLEKKHVIVGQDTDAVSNPLESDMDWVVRFDKEDFIGRAGILGARQRGLRNKLVGFTMRDGRVPEDGDPVVMGRRPVGRVTSARANAPGGKGFGLAWVPVELAEDGTEIRIRVDGLNLPARVTLQPFYDPDGRRLRE